jgi:diacylglycerol O-acyltransferase
MDVLAPQDAMFLVGESREQPMHVGGLLLFDRPEGAGPDYLSALYRELVNDVKVHPLFARRVRRGPAGLWSWEPDEDIDLEYHVRLSGLARPGRIRELLELTSRLHGTLLDRNRPLWEMYLIDGVQGRRFAIYTKVHHAMIDGVSALRLLQSTLTTDPERTGMPLTYALPVTPRGLAGPSSGNGRSVQALAVGAGRAVAGVGKAAAGVARVVGDAVGLSPLAARSVLRARTDPSASAFTAPRSILNVPVSAARRFAAQSWPMERLDNIRTATGATVNDVVLAICAGALRRYLLEQDALPAKPLIALVPVSVRAKGIDAHGGSGGDNSGNALATLLCDLATDEPDPATRLARVRASTKRGKEMLSNLSPTQNLILGALGLGAAGAGSMVPGLAGRAVPPYNLVISNVPGPVDQTLYWNGARLHGMYPASVVFNGQALNITVTSSDHHLHVGLTGCRRRVPHLQHLLGHLEDAITELEQL